jgi:hypothetical protein
MNRITTGLCALAAASVVGLVAAAPAQATAPAALDYTSQATLPVTRHWQSAPCPNSEAAPIRCLYQDGDLRGSVEALRFPAEPGHGRGKSQLRDIAASAYGGFREDRLTLCGSGYTVDPLRLVGRRSAGQAGVRWTLTLRRADGTVDEQIVLYASIADGYVRVLTASGTDEDSCYPGEGYEWPPSLLGANLHVLDRAVANAVLPASVDSSTR